MVTKILDKSKILNVVNDFFKHFQIWCGRTPVSPTPHEIEHYLAKNLQMFNNGQLVARSATNYLDRLQRFQKKYSGFKISQPLEEPLIYGNQVAIYYTIDLTARDGEHAQVYVMALLTFEDDKISRWVEVTHEKNTGNWDT